MSILTRSGRTAIAQSIKSQPLHLAWGSGGSWTTTVPPENADATALLAEVGRRTVTQCEYVTPDNSGDIEIIGAGKFSISSTPTNMLWAMTRFDFGDASTATIREIGLFVGTVVQSGLPSGQRYFTPSQITSSGTLLQLENLAAIYRSPSERQTFEMLIIF
jgi:hypothetical protein